MNLLRNIIRLGTIKQVFNRFGIIRSQVEALDSGSPENVINLHPYGFNANPPINSQIVIMSVFGHLENKYGIPYNPTDTPKLQSGESVVYNHFGSQIYLKANGDIDIIPSGANLNITVATTNISGNLEVSGSVNTDDVYKVNGTQVVSSQGAAVPDATGGIVVDAEARTAINTLLARLRVHGLIA